MDREWTLENELRELTGTRSIEGSFKTLGLLGKDEGLTGYHYSKWSRGGAETYVLPFEVEGAKSSKKKFILKAYTPTAIGRSLDKAFENLFEKRRILTGYGIRAPKVYANYKCSWIEDFIAFSMRDYFLSRTNAAHTQTILAEAQSVIEVLTSNLYSPISPMGDMRTDGENVYLVDFGTDIGTPTDGDHLEATIEKIFQWLDNVSPELRSQYAKVIVQGNDKSILH